MAVDRVELSVAGEPRDRSVEAQVRKRAGQPQRARYRRWVGRTLAGVSVGRRSGAQNEGMEPNFAVGPDETQHSASAVA